MVLSRWFPNPMNSVVYTLGAAGLLLGLFIHRRRNFVTTKLRGPRASSWLFGSELELEGQDEVGDLDFVWVREYGATFAVKAPWGKTNVMTADPRALQHIFHTSGYRYPKQGVVNQSVRNITGRGIVWAAGSDHQRHRKVMNPVFTAQQLRGFLPVFQRTASRMTQKWKDRIQTGTKNFNVSRWLARATLDAIGEAAFDYEFGALDDADGELTKSFDNLFVDTVLHPPLWDILFKALWVYIPTPILQLVEYIPTKEYIRFRKFKALTKRVAKELINLKTDTAVPEDSARDVMSVLVKANVSEDPKLQLDEDEILSQMATLMLAGHETTASTLTWLLYELCRHPEDQKRVREEVQELRRNLPTGAEFSIANLESLTFMNAVLKEVLRLHPIVPTLTRTADCDDILPLALPITTKDGDSVSEIPIQKGTDFMISICAYNRLPSVWGADAEQWNPQRFLDHSEESEKRTSVGVFANLMTFSAGIRGCIGWRFALIELQALFGEIIEKFEFSLPEDVQIMRLPAGLMVPMVKDRMHEGAQMPLNVVLVEELD